MLGEILLGHVSLQLGSRGQDLVAISGEGLVCEEDLLWLLQAVQFVFVGQSVKIFHNFLNKFGVCQCLILSCFSASKCCSLGRFYNTDHDAKVLCGISGDEGLSEVLGLDKDILDFLWGNVLSLGKFKDVLDSVNHLDLPI